MCGRTTQEQREVCGNRYKAAKFRSGKRSKAENCPHWLATGIALLRGGRHAGGRDSCCLIRYELAAAVDGQIDGELRALGAGLERDLAAVLGFDDAARDVQAKAGSAADGLGGEEGFEDVLLILFGNARSMIGETDGDAVSVA